MATLRSKLIRLVWHFRARGVDAEDVAHDVIVNALHTGQPLEVHSDNYWYVAVRNTLYSIWRKQRKLATVSMADLPERVALENIPAPSDPLPAEPFRLVGNPIWEWLLNYYSSTNSHSNYDRVKAHRYRQIIKQSLT